MGTPGNDVIDIVPSTTPSYVTVLVNGKVAMDQSWASLGSKGLTIDGDGGTDKVNIGAGNLTSFAGRITILDTGGQATININDSLDNASVTLTQELAGKDDIIVGISPSPIAFNISQTKSTTIKLGNGNNVVHSGAGAQTIIVGNGKNTLYGGSGSDTLTAGTGSNTFVTVGDGPAQLNGGGGTNSYWTDAGSSQKINDPWKGWESLIGNIHTISGFQKLVVDYVRGGTVSQTPPLGALGGSLLEPDPTVISPGPDGIGTVTTTYAYEIFGFDPLFAPGGPTQNDIHQGGIGDCGFLAGLAGFAKVDQNWIEQSIVPLGDGTYAVRFFNSHDEPVYYRIDAELPVTGGGYFVGANAGADNCIWAPLLEKAFTFFRLDQGSYQSIQGGGCGTALNSLGDGANAFWGSSPTNVLANIAATLKTGQVVLAGTIVNPDPADYVVGNHCYTVESVQFNSKGVPVSITLRNPWGYDGPNIKDNPSAYGTLSASQFYSDFFGADAGWT